MRSSNLGVIGLGAAVAALTGCATQNMPAAHPPNGRPEAAAVVTPAPAATQPLLRPYPAGQGNTNGLSRDPDDCDRGCIGGNPD